MKNTLEFYIHGIKWDLELVDNYDDIDANGITYYSEYAIKVVKTLHETQLRSTLIHEVTHAFRWTYGQVSEMELLNIPTEEVEEIVANTIEVFGADIFECVDDIMVNLFFNHKENIWEVL
jgi:hypothetical protein